MAVFDAGLEAASTLRFSVWKNSHVTIPSDADSALKQPRFPINKQTYEPSLKLLPFTDKKVVTSML